MARNRQRKKSKKSHKGNPKHPVTRGSLLAGFRALLLQKRNAQDALAVVRTEFSQLKNLAPGNSRLKEVEKDFNELRALEKSLTNRMAEIEEKLDRMK